MKTNIFTMTRNKIITIVGNQTTPLKHQWALMLFSYCVHKDCFQINTGTAKGADEAARRGAECTVFSIKDGTPESTAIAAELHKSNWSRWSPISKAYHSRNVMQVLGRDLQTPVARVVCYTRDGCISHETASFDTGGTRTAISIASQNNIPVINIQRPDHLERIVNYIGIDERSLPQSVEDEKLLADHLEIRMSDLKKPGSMGEVLTCLVSVSHTFDPEDVQGESIRAECEDSPVIEMSAGTSFFSPNCPPI